MRWLCLWANDLIAKAVTLAWLGLMLVVMWGAAMLGEAGYERVSGIALGSVMIFTIVSSFYVYGTALRWLNRRTEQETRARIHPSRVSPITNARR